MSEVRVLRDVRIPTGDAGATLSADVFLPAGDAPVPALVTVLPYRKDGVAGMDEDATHRWFAAHGYASLLVDLRGTGSSDGPQRPPFDAADADDGVAAVGWAAAQPWCTGAVGAWGMSYGAVVAMRTAVCRPPALRAILPVMGLLDPERDLVHPAGLPGGLGSLGTWGMQQLLFQLLPPMQGRVTEAEERRWRYRLRDAEPSVVDLVTHGPGDPVWRDRVVDAAAITVPAFCVAGWRDLNRDAMVRAYERMTGPKRLLVGPWTHTMPHRSPFAAVDFLPMALRWWDHWLRGVDTGPAGEPPVTVHVEGGAPRWRSHPSWPPAGEPVVHTTGADRTLLPGDARPAPRIVIAEGTPDPGSGAQDGAVRGPGGAADPADGGAEPGDLTVETGPLAAALLVAGRPEVTVELAAGSAADRLVVRLTALDAAGRATPVASGTVALTGVDPTAGCCVDVPLDATCQAVPAGHRLRVGVSTADFPRLWPAAAPAVLRLARVALTLPVVPAGSGVAAILPATDSASGPEPAVLPEWTVDRDPVSGGPRVVVTDHRDGTVPGGAYRLAFTRRLTATAGEDAGVCGGSTATVTSVADPAAPAVTVHVALHLTGDEVTATGRVEAADRTVLDRRWSAKRGGRG